MHMIIKRNIRLHTLLLLLGASLFVGGCSAIGGTPKFDGARAFDSSQRVQTIHDWHRNVERYYIGMKFVRKRQCLQPICGCANNLEFTRR